MEEMPDWIDPNRANEILSHVARDRWDILSPDEAALAAALVTEREIASELLSALKYLLELGGDDDRRIAAEAAIAKAERRT